MDIGKETRVIQVERATKEIEPIEVEVEVPAREGEREG